MPGESSPHVIQTIQEIKSSVEKPHRCGWLENLSCNEAKRLQTRRYRDSAAKIMELLRPDVFGADIDKYIEYYHSLEDLHESKVDQRLAAAKKLWDYVLSLDEWVSHSRITWSSGSPSGRRHNNRPPRSPSPKVHFEDESSKSSDTALVKPSDACNISQWWKPYESGPTIEFSWKAQWVPAVTISPPSCT
ncbi:hypothetical protein FKP32DRAFT_920924 [Trametes sanguinea]|nr:hypothetical protein FKP32DRAFT_920924 [Trametes sanguinea]